MQQHIKLIRTLNDPFHKHIDRITRLQALISIEEKKLFKALKEQKCANVYNVFTKKNNAVLD